MRVWMMLVVSLVMGCVFNLEKGEDPGEDGPASGNGGVVDGDTDTDTEELHMISGQNHLQLTIPDQCSSTS